MITLNEIELRRDESDPEHVRISSRLLIREQMMLSRFAMHDLPFDAIREAERKACQRILHAIYGEIQKDVWELNRAIRHASHLEDVPEVAQALKKLQDRFEY